MTSTPVYPRLATTQNNDDEIDLRQVASALVRRWPWMPAVAPSAFSSPGST